MCIFPHVLWSWCVCFCSHFVSVCPTSKEWRADLSPLWTDEMLSTILCTWRRACTWIHATKLQLTAEVPEVLLHRTNGTASSRSSFCWACWGHGFHPRMCRQTAASSSPSSSLFPGTIWRDDTGGRCCRTNETWIRAHGSALADIRQEYWFCREVGHNSGPL